MANILKDYFLGSGSRYKNAADNYKKAADKALDIANIKNEATDFASNANAATRDSMIFWTLNMTEMQLSLYPHCILEEAESILTLFERLTQLC